ncbi:hypothetical protein VTO42DRAFT_2687 [Malbranchea cinnamomea]
MSSTGRRSATVGSTEASFVDKTTEAGKGDFAAALKDPYTTAQSPNGEYFATRTASASGRRESRDATSPGSDSVSPQRSGSLDRRMSKEWDAAKVPPSRFQRRAGSIFSTMGSRDSHISRKDRDSAYHAKLKEKGWGHEKGSGLW